LASSLSSLSKPKYAFLHRYERSGLVVDDDI
jgi:hypothetical protein